MWQLLADAASDGSAVSPSTSLILGVVSGVTAIVVSFIGYLGLKHKSSPQTPPPTPTTPGNPSEPEWVLDLRRDLAHERTLREKHDEDIDKYQRMLYLAGIDPETGLKIEKDTP